MSRLQKKQRYCFCFRAWHENHSYLLTGEAQCCQHVVFGIQGWCVSPCKLTKLWQKFLVSLPIHSIWNPLFCFCMPTFKSLMRVSRSLICSRVWVLAWTLCSWDVMSWSSSPIVLKSFSSVITQLSQAGESNGNQYVSLIFNTENISLSTLISDMRWKSLEACHLVLPEEQRQQQSLQHKGKWPKPEVRRRFHLHLTRWAPL